jgi:23S rRNA (adenine2503-C2)-methyltransferase
MTTKPHYLTLAPYVWTEWMASRGEKSFRAKQVCDWIFKRRASATSEMSNISKPIRVEMEELADWTMPEIDSRIDGEDGSTKLLLKSERGYIETVILRYGNRVSLCVSSQVGCKLACTFCQTGKLGFMRHLRSEEILSQFVLAEQIVKQEDRSISHIVFMGMGEPLDNYEPVKDAVKLLTSPEAYGLNPKHVTVSTSGMVPKIKLLADEVKCSLAISLHASRDELRTDLMPINRKYNLAALKESLIYWQKATGQIVTIEYIMIKDKNCGRREAKELVKFIHGMRAKVNLIPFNSHPGMPFERPSDEEIREFQKYLSDRSIPAPVRYSKGLDVSAACGQLAAKKVDELDLAPARSRLISTDHQSTTCR